MNCPSLSMWSLIFTGVWPTNALLSTLFCYHKNHSTTDHFRIYQKVHYLSTALLAQFKKSVWYNKVIFLSTYEAKILYRRSSFSSNLQSTDPLCKEIKFQNSKQRAVYLVIASHPFEIMFGKWQHYRIYTNCVRSIILCISFRGWASNNKIQPVSFNCTARGFFTFFQELCSSTCRVCDKPSNFWHEEKIIIGTILK